MASWRPMFPTVTPPEKKIQGSQERTYRKSGDVYLREKVREMNHHRCQACYHGNKHDL